MSKKKFAELERRVAKLENMTLENNADEIPVSVPGGSRTIKPGPTSGSYNKASGKLIMK